MNDQTPENPYPGPGEAGPGQPGSERPTGGPAGAAYGPYASQGPGGYGQMPPRTNGKAIAALVTGISALVLSMCCLGIAGVVAIFLGVQARNEIATSGGRQDGEGLALGGIITGALATLVSVAILAFVIIALATGNTEFTVRNDGSDF